jgi:hypothetical protein
MNRGNFRELPRFIGLARHAGASQVSFLAVDVANLYAFGRQGGQAPDLALRESELPEFGRLLHALEQDHADDFHSGFIAESPAKLWRIHQFFTAVRGLAAFPPVRCNAPEFSAVVGARGAVSPCFFISGPKEAVCHDNLERTLNSDRLIALRQSIHAGSRPECARCVCSMWRDPHELAASALGSPVRTVPRERFA